MINISLFLVLAIQANFGVLGEIEYEDSLKELCSKYKSLPICALRDSTRTEKSQDSQITGRSLCDDENCSMVRPKAILLDQTTTEEPKELTSQSDLLNITIVHETADQEESPRVDERSERYRSVENEKDEDEEFENIKRVPMDVIKGRSNEIPNREPETSTDEKSNVEQLNGRNIDETNADETNIDISDSDEQLNEKLEWLKHGKVLQITVPYSGRSYEEPRFDDAESVHHDPEEDDEEAEDMKGDDNNDHPFVPRSSMLKNEFKKDQIKYSRNLLNRISSKRSVAFV